MCWTHLEDKRVRARKPHRCFMCGEAVGAGEEYVRRKGVGDGGVESFAMHPECESESSSWEDADWECFFEGDMERPRKAVEA